MSIPAILIEKSRNKKGWTLFCAISCNYGMGTGIEQILSEHYSDSKLVRKLMELGNLSYLGKRLNPIAPENHSLDHPEAGTTVAYVRDNRETWARNREVITARLRVILDRVDASLPVYMYECQSQEWYRVLRDGDTICKFPLRGVVERLD